MKNDEMNLVEKLVNNEFEIQIRRFYELTPLKEILEISLQNHETPNCKVRAITEGIYSWYKLTDDELFRELAYYIIEYAKIFTNEVTNDAVIQIKEKLWNYSEKEFPYFSIEVQGRVKSMNSEIHDLITKLIKIMIIQNVLDNHNNIDKFLEGSANICGTEIVELYLKKLREQYYNSLNKDIFGFMFILDYNDRKKYSDNPEFLKDSTLKFSQTCIEILKNSGTEILGIKDFISIPKNEGYTAFHIITRICEIQLLTRGMYIKNNDPRNPASHINYKNTFLNGKLLKITNQVVFNSLKEELPSELFKFITSPEDLDNIDSLNCHQYDKKTIRKAYQRLTDRISEPANPFSSKHLTRTPHDEIPKNIDDLHEFEGIKVLEKFKKDHTVFSSSEML